MGSNSIPIVIICYNNYKYVDNTIKQYESLLDSPNILVIDNYSTCKYTVAYINDCKIKYNVIKCDTNNGHLVWTHPFIFNTLPDKFIITDPDLQFNKKMPKNFIETIVQISDKYQSQRVGFALDISEPDKMFPYNFYDFGFNGIPTIWESQKQYWANRASDSSLEMYFSPIDTTFCLFNKNYSGSHIRIAGDYTMKHLPWYIDVEGISRLSRYIMYKDASAVSSIKCFEIQYLKDNNYLTIQKRDELFLIQMDGGENDNFWKDIYPTWENEAFDIFDEYLKKDKQFLDIGAWIGPSSLYASRLSSYVVCIEADTIIAKNLQHNINTNFLDTNIDIETSAIYCESSKMLFGPNSNSSTSQIKLTQTTDFDVLTNTITLDEVIEKYKLNNLSLIKVDIGGGEEYILNDLLEYSKINNVPLYITFYYERWNDKNLDRFLHLNKDQKEQIVSSPFSSILLNVNMCNI